MAIGDRIKRIRNFRGLTQKDLGLAVGFDDKTADVRIAQYESGTRTPKEDMLKRITKALDVNYRSIYEPSLYAAEDFMYTLFELDEHIGVSLYEIEDKLNKEKHIATAFEYGKILDGFLEEWKLRKQELENNGITKEEYIEWKLNWPATADSCKKKKYYKKWRK